MSIPVEMTHFPSWVLWRYETHNEKPTKIPYQPRNMMKASVSEPSHWATYGEALRVLQSGIGQFNGLGFVLSKNDPYTIIDIDDPGNDPKHIETAKAVLEAFADTYSEVSPSGKGLHIVVRGWVGPGRRRKPVEVYSTERYMTMTGNAYRDLPISDNDYHLANLYHELGGSQLTLEIEPQDKPQKCTDEEIYNRAKETNEKFLELWNGRYQQWYTSQSEADIALVNIIGFYSRNRAQIARMFMFSALGKRKKANRADYLKKMIDKSFDNMPPEISLEQLMGNLHAQLEAEKEERKKNPKPMLGEGWSLPPGLLGELAQFIYEAAPRPVQEIALAAAIALMAGICGRSYNISSTGLNQYVLLLAKTGRGKEGAQSGISKLMKFVTATLPGAVDFIGPGDMASGQALVKHLAANPCFVSVLGEFGHMMQQMCDKHAPSHLTQLRRVLLDLFNKSGKNDVLNPTIYSDKTQNTSVVQSPALTIFGETTPETFFAHVDEGIIASGLLPRFTCIEYTGNRPNLNKAHASVTPSGKLVEAMGILCANALTLAHNRATIEVASDDKATLILDAFNAECDKRINDVDANDVVAQMWNRAHLKVLKLSALIAVGCNPFEPTVTEEIAQWAKGLIEKDVANIIHRFESGTVGRDTNEQNQFVRMSDILKDYIMRPHDATMTRYQVREDMHRDRVISYTYIQKRLAGQPAFKGDRMGAAFSIRRTLDILIHEGAIREVHTNQLLTAYKYCGKAYYVVDLKTLDT